MKKKRLIIVLASLLFAMGILAAGCGGAEPAEEEIAEPVETEAEAEEENNMSNAENTIVEIVMEGGGEIIIELDSVAAPISVANFLKLVDERYYDGLTFHRIIPGFMIQGGCPDGTGAGGPDERIKGEFSANGWDNPISHKRGVISMARTPDYDSAGSQFFITNDDAEFLDGQYAAFGIVQTGMNVVDVITATECNGETPVDPPTIKSIRRK